MLAAGGDRGDLDGRAGLALEHAVRDLLVLALAAAELPHLAEAPGEEVAAARDGGAMEGAAGSASDGGRRVELDELRHAGEGTGLVLHVADGHAQLVAVRAAEGVDVAVVGDGHAVVLPAVHGRDAEVVQGRNALEQLNLRARRLGHGGLAVLVEPAREHAAAHGLDHERVVAAHADRARVVHLLVAARVHHPRRRQVLAPNLLLAVHALAVLELADLAPELPDLADAPRIH
mmetsp:Transcript_9677/g.31019  ORF Transcript_9677/g.31019 Transcript_9677/m.31019 type:complete len:232 (+) Transcript_9677:143-838(+)